jgi:hypothetical protein
MISEVGFVIVATEHWAASMMMFHECREQLNILGGSYDYCIGCREHHL